MIYCLHMICFWGFTSFNVHHIVLCVRINRIRYIYATNLAFDLVSCHSVSVDTENVLIFHVWQMIFNHFERFFSVSIYLFYSLVRFLSNGRFRSVITFQWWWLAIIWVCAAPAVAFPAKVIPNMLLIAAHHTNQAFLIQWLMTSVTAS